MSLISVYSLVICLSSSTGQINNNDDLKYIFHFVSKEVEDVANSIFRNLKLNKHFARIPMIQKQLEIYNNSKEFSNKSIEDFLKLTDNMSAIVYNENQYYDSYDIISSILNVTLNFNMEDIIRKEFESKVPTLITRDSHSNPANNVGMNLSRKLPNKNKKLIETLSHGTNSEFIRRSKRQRRKAIIQKGKNELGLWKHKRHASEVSNSARRMYQGKRAWIKLYPFMVSVHENGRFVCAGCIIRKNLVISAASCFEKVQQDQDDRHSITLRVGSNYVSKGGFVVFAVRAIFHPSYDPVSLRNNLVLLNVNNDAFNKYPWIKRIKYRHNNATSFTGDGNLGSIKILGWGEQDDTRTHKLAYDRISPVSQNRTLEITPSHNISLSFDQLEAYKLEECMEIYSRYFVTRNNLCAGFLLTGNGACKYDVGGPGIQNGLLLGIISFGPALCGTRDKPTVFTRLAPYVTWIHEVVHKTIPELQKKASLAKQRSLDEHENLRKYLSIEYKNEFDDTSSQQSDITSVTNLSESDGMSIEISESSGERSPDKKYWMDIIAAIATKSTNSNFKLASSHQHKRKRRKSTPPDLAAAVYSERYLKSLGYNPERINHHYHYGE